MERAMVTTKPSLTLLALGAFALAACGGSKDKAADSAAAATPPAAAPAPAPAATPAANPAGGVNIVSPKEGDTTSADVTIVLSKEGPVAIEKASGTKAEGVGHYHLFLDTAATADGTVIPATNKTAVVHIGSGDSTFTWKGLKPGPHELIAVIGYGDHAAMSAKRDTVHFVVKK